jgi:WD40 repeat protein
VHIGQRLLGHKDWVGSVVFSPDGKMLASGSCGRVDNEGLCLQGEIILWDMATRQPIGTPLTGHIDSVRSVAFSPDGKMLASASCSKLNPNKYYECLQGEIIFWDVATRRPIGDPIKAHTDFVNNVVFSPDGKMLASSSNDSTVILWDVATRQPIGQSIEGSNVAFSPGGKTLAAGTNLTIVLWNIVTGQPIGQPLEEPTGQLHSLTFSPDGKILASGGVDGTSTLWDVATQQPIGNPLRASDGDWTRGVAFSPDGKMLASATKTISLWDLETYTTVSQPLIGHWGVVASVAFSPDGKILASGGGDGTIILWDLNPQSWIESNCERVSRNLTRAEWAQYFPNEEYRTTCPQWPLEPDAKATP